jgi:hypothetical protein
VDLRAAAFAGDTLIDPVAQATTEEIVRVLKPGKPVKR